MSSSVTFSIAGPHSEEFKSRLQDEAIKRGISLSEYITEILAEHLRRSNARTD